MVSHLIPLAVIGRRLAETGRLHGLERLDPRRRVIHVTGLDAIIDGERGQRLGRCALKNMAAFTDRVVHRSGLPGEHPRPIWGGRTPR